MNKRVRLGRRAVLSGGVLWLGAALSQETDGRPAVRFGIVTDVHHADKPELRTRYYRESIRKLGEGVQEFQRSRVEFLVELGDLVDAAKDLDTERNWLKEAFAVLRTAGVPAHCVLGNHCVQTLSKAQFLKEAGQPRSYFSFDRGGVHFVVLDACFRKDGVSYDAGNFDWKDTEIPGEEREWLKQDLAGAGRPVVVFVHQRLDTADVHSVASAVEVRRILEESRKVTAVFQGHSHKNDYNEINGIHYCTLRAIIEGTGMESSGYSIVSVHPSGSLRVAGFREQRDYNFT